MTCIVIVDSETGLYNSQSFGVGALKVSQYYDPSLSLWLGVDPLADKFYSWSPYHYATNNPINIIDYDGRDTSFANNASRKEFLRTYNNINSEVDYLRGEIDNLLNSWTEDGCEGSEELTNLNGQLSEVLEMQEAFNAVICSDEMFYYNSKPNPRNSRFGGGIKYNKAKDRYEINSLMGNSTTITHETTHGRQILEGFISWGKGVALSNYDYADEVEAFTNGFNYGRIFNGWPAESQASIRKSVKRAYSSKSFIIKSYDQTCR